MTDAIDHSGTGQRGENASNEIELNKIKEFSDNTQDLIISQIKRDLNRQITCYRQSMGYISFV